MHRTILAASAALCLVSLPAVAATQMFTPTASEYQSTADLPAGLHIGAFFLEDFEDLTLDPFLSASAGSRLAPGGSTDSVDLDGNGVDDGSGTTGGSHLSSSGVAGITFTFDSPVVAAGIAWTDGAGTITFRAFAPGGGLLGEIVDYFETGSTPDTSIFGTTAEDRYFGARDESGIGSIFISNSAGGIEVDHVTWSTGLDESAAVPLPGAAPLLLAGLGGLAALRRRR